MTSNAITGRQNITIILLGCEKWLALTAPEVNVIADKSSMIEAAKPE